MRSRVAILTAVFLLLAGLGSWRLWLSGLSRPNLEDVLPPGADLRLRLNHWPEFQDGLRSLNGDGAGGRSGSYFLLNQAARDEALAALYPGGRLLILSRAGLREALALKLASSLRLVRKTKGSPVLRYRGGSRSGVWFLFRSGGILLLSRDAGLVQEGSTRLEAAADSGKTPAGPAGLVLNWAGPAGSLEARAQVAPGGPDRPARLEGEIRYKPSGGTAPWATLKALSGAGLWSRFPVHTLAALDLASASPLLESLGPSGDWGPASPQKDRALRALAKSEVGLALTGLDRRGPLPLPQLAALVKGEAGLLDSDFLAWLDQALKGLSRGHFGLEDRSFSGFSVYGVRLPVTELFGPTLTAQSGDLVLASSFAAATSVLASGPRSFDPGPSALYQAPALAYLFLDIPSLASQLQSLGEDLRTSGLLNPGAEKNWTSHISPALALLEAAAPLRAALELQGAEFLLRLECGEKPAARGR